MSHLESYLLKNSPNTIYYIPNFITEEEEKTLLKNIYDSPKPKWTQLKNRRLQNWGGLPSNKGMVPETIPDWLNTYCKRVAELGVLDSYTPNHILLNEYLPGQGIMPHEDGPMYYPTVATITLGSHTLLDFYKPLSQMENCESDASLSERYVFSLFEEPRSLVILQEDMYKIYLHGIKELKQDEINQNKIINFDRVKNYNLKDSKIIDRDTRISLTIRYVPKVLKISLNSLLNKKF